MSKITLSPITSVTNQESFLAALEVWRQDIEDWSDTILSRNGQSPNTMAANLDMDSNRILNYPAPVDDNDLVRLVDVAEGIRGEKGDQGDPGLPGNGLEDGDYTDIVVTGNGSVLTIDPTVMTAAARTLNDDTTVGAMRTTLGLGNSATKDVGTGSTNVAAGNDARFSDIQFRDVSSNTVIALTDQGLRVSANSVTITLPTHANVAFNQGKVIFIRVPAGVTGCTLVRQTGGVGLVLNDGAIGQDITLNPGTMVTLIQDVLDGWVCAGPGAS